MLVILHCDHRELLGGGAVLLHVLNTGITKHLRRKGSAGDAASFAHDVHVVIERIGTVSECCLEGAASHLVETDCQNAVCVAARDQLAAKVKGSRSSGAVVVHVNDRDASEAKLVDSTLTASRIT